MKKLILSSLMLIAVATGQLNAQHNVNNYTDLSTAITDLNTAGSGTINLTGDVVFGITDHVLEISGNITILGNGYAINGNGYSPLFKINNHTVVFKNLILTGGQSTSNTIGSAAAIYNAGNLTITNSLIHNNLSLFSGGAIYNDGALTIINSTITENISLGSIGSGGLNNSSSLILYNSIVWGNSGTQKSDHWTDPDGINFMDIRNSIIGDNTPIDPFVNRSGGDYRPSTTGAAYNTGVNSNYPGDINADKDIVGKSRLGGASIDIGAYEYPRYTVSITVVDDAFEINPDDLEVEVDEGQSYNTLQVFTPGNEMVYLTANGVTVEPTMIVPGAKIYTIANVTENVKVVISAEIPTGINLGTDNSVEVRTYDNTIHVNTGGETILFSVWDVSGKLITQQQLTDSLELPLPKGVYIVKAGDKVVKVAL